MTALAIDDHPYAPPEERAPPASVEAEQSVLGALLIDPSCLPLVAELIDQRSFFRHEHRLVFAAIDAMARAGSHIDDVALHDELVRRGQADDVGGMAYLAALAACVPSARNVRRHAEIVAARYADRALMQAADEMREVARNAAVPIEARMERIASLLARSEQLRQGVGRRLPLMRLAALREAAERVRWTVKHVIPAASIGMLFGGSGTFKSFIALDAALHVAHGLPWMGRLTRSAPVLYIAAEGGAGLWGRIEAWHEARRLRWEDAPLYVLPAALDLTQDAWRVVEAAQAVGCAPGMVVVDTLSQTYSGEENSANEMAAYLREIGLRFRELWQCAVLLVHHTGHAATERPRGSSAIRSNVDFLLGVCRDEKEMLATVSCVKQKDGELFGDSTFALSVHDLGADEDGDKITSLVARHLSSADEVERARLAERAAGRGGRNTAFVELLQDFNGRDVRELRKAFYELLDGVDAEAKKKAFFRARQWALDHKYFEDVGGIVVVSRDEGRNSGPV